ncbi:hypothetical protein [Vibrio maerlii]|uniref:hypothetical protein n=1 Tax=Vibrio maerlii TaxID=2231648 RepID=UPI001F13A340|nr:hypothetical protein [Vibrio maerlii]
MSRATNDTSQVEKLALSDLAPSDLPQKNTAQQKRGRLMLFALVLTFALPALLAKVILSQQWYQSGVTNHGEWFESRILANDIGIDIEPFQHSDPVWLLGYVMPEDCLALCQKELELLNQSHIALGKYQQRVELVAIETVSDDLLIPESLKGQYSSLIADKTKLLNQVSSGQVVIIDPLGEVIMKYRLSSQEADNTDPKAAKGMLTDLRKLLKLSRVG